MVILPKGSREYGQPPVIGMLILGRSKKRHRGTELLDELVEVLLALSQFTEEEYLDFAAAITVINKHWLKLKQDTGAGRIGRGSEFIRLLIECLFCIVMQANLPPAVFWSSCVTLNHAICLMMMLNLSTT